jgi:hypothetical protein
MGKAMRRFILRFSLFYVRLRLRPAGLCGPDLLAVALQLDEGRKHVPKIATGIGELDGDLAAFLAFAVDVYDASFAFFVRVAVHQQHFLAALQARSEWEQAPVQVHGVGLSHFAEWVVFRRAAVNTHGNRKRQALAAASLYHLLPLRIECLASKS